MPSNILPSDNQNIRPVSQPTQQVKPLAGQKTQGFQEILRSKISPNVKFSAHALERLQKRNITLSQETMNQLNNAVAKAESKGCRESLVLLKDLALIVSVKNRTVITAIDGERIKENIFTNIDSAVIV